jgi:molybdopterin molybdotransferase
VVAALGAAIAASDAVVTVGGVSVGERDHVPAALARLGAEVRVHGVPMKPGKPFLFALAGGKPVFGLPGSPSACLAAFEVFARPALLALAGAARLTRPEVSVRLAEAASGRPGRARLLWARLEPGGSVRPLGRDAAQVRGPALADALLLVPAGAGDLAAGAEVVAWLLEDDAPCLPVP